MPLVLGDETSRVITAAFVLFWTIVVVLFWDLSASWRTLLLTPALIVVARVLMYRDTKSDKITFWIWNLWIMNVYLTPLSNITI